MEITKLNILAICQQRFGAIGVLGFIKVSFVLGSWLFNRYIWLTKSPTDAKPRDVSCKLSENQNMREELEFMIDTIEIVPDNSICYVQAPSIDNANFLELFTESKYDWARQVVLNSENKEKIKNLLLRSEFEDQFHNVTIEKEEEKIFEGFDGMEIGEVSKKLNLPNWYVEKYIETKYCNYAKDW